MKCSNCGKELENNAKFCTYCGAEISEEIKIQTEVEKPESRTKVFFIKFGTLFLTLIIVAMIKLLMMAIMGSANFGPTILDGVPALLPFGIWFLLNGIFLKRPKERKWGYWTIGIVIVTTVAFMFYESSNNASMVTQNESQSQRTDTSKNIKAPNVTSDSTDENHLKTYKDKCDAGDFSSCGNLGYIYDMGKETKQDYSKAKIFYTKACGGGDLWGCANLGFMFENGKGMKKNYLKAVELYKKACDGGYTHGCGNLGLMYILGQGVKKNYSKAKIFYTKACDGGSVRACSNLGSMHEKGEGTKQNYSKAVRFYEKACDGKDALGCLNLGILYLDGLGVKQNNSKAKNYFGKACDSGNERGCKGYDHLK